MLGLESENDGQSYLPKMGFAGVMWEVGSQNSVFMCM